jgi:hypothetical protein
MIDYARQATTIEKEGTQMKPQVFIGSSSEKLLYAYAVQEQLSAKADVQLWNQGFFSLNTSYLDGLLKGLKETDFGIFIFSPDDIATIRDEMYQTVRDNVLFEFGMFLGGLGQNRSLFIMPRVQPQLRLPTDLLGISTVSFDADKKPIEAALGPSCFRILQAIDKHGVRQERFATPTVETISNPKILCTCSAHFFSVSFEKDAAIIRREMQKISSDITVEHNMTSEKLRELLLDNVFDIMHVGAYVDHKTGDLYFNEVQKCGRIPEGVEIDTLPASQFAKLVELSRARLVVLASCDSLLLAAKLAKTTNMIAATDWVDLTDMLNWELSFYKCISKGISLSNAFETAASLSEAPMLLLKKKDLAFIH